MQSSNSQNSDNDNSLISRTYNYLASFFYTANTTPAATIAAPTTDASASAPSAAPQPTQPVTVPVKNTRVSALVSRFNQQADANTQTHQTAPKTTNTSHRIFKPIIVGETAQEETARLAQEAIYANRQRTQREKTNQDVRNSISKRP